MYKATIFIAIFLIGFNASAQTVDLLTAIEIAQAQTSGGTNQIQIFSDSGEPGNIVRDLVIPNFEIRREPDQTRIYQYDGSLRSILIPKTTIKTNTDSAGLFRTIP